MMLNKSPKPGHLIGSSSNSSLLHSNLVYLRERTLKECCTVISWNGQAHSEAHISVPRLFQHLVLSLLIFCNTNFFQSFAIQVLSENLSIKEWLALAVKDHQQRFRQATDDIPLHTQLKVWGGGNLCSLMSNTSIPSHDIYYGLCALYTRENKHMPIQLLQLVPVKDKFHVHSLQWHQNDCCLKMLKITIQYS